MQQEGGTMVRVSLTDVTAARSSLSKLLQSKTDSEFHKLSLTLTSLDSRMRE